jgi:UDP-2-acetamido-3-amino-2,3-dideoxy-glucuronate N-acetyltransferase
MIHPKSDVQSVQIGSHTNVWQFCVILPGAIIGDHCNINANVLIENDVVIGDSVTIKSGVQVWDGIRIEDGVFVGPNVTFTNDLMPRSKKYPDKFCRTIVRKGSSIGANSTILPNVEIGEYALIGAGSVVTKNVAAQQLVIGNPARPAGWVGKSGNKLTKIDDVHFCDEHNGDLYLLTEKGIKKI